MSAREHPRVHADEPCCSSTDPSHAPGVPARRPRPRRRRHHRHRLLQADHRLDHRQHPLRPRRRLLDHRAGRGDGRRLHRLGEARPSTSAPPPACRRPSTTAPAPGTTTAAATTRWAPATSPSRPASIAHSDPCARPRRARPRHRRRQHATVFYSTATVGWTTVNIHYAPTGGSWTTVPGVGMETACTGWGKKTVDLGTRHRPPGGLQQRQRRLGQQQRRQLHAPGRAPRP